MNRQLRHKITEDLKREYHSNGVVCLRDQFDREWVDHLLKLTSSAIAQPERNGYRGLAKSEGFISLKWPSRFNKGIAQFFRDSPAAEMVAQVIGSKELRFFNDQIFAKEPGVEQKTFWHHDAAGWPVIGEQVPSLWIPLTPVTRENSGLVCVRASHQRTSLYWPITDKSKNLERPPAREECPDFDRVDDAEILSWDMAPGDALLIHPRTVHAAGGNQSKTQGRVAITSRWFGDDIVWDPRPECVEIPFYSSAQMKPGAAPGGEEFPLVYSVE